MENKEKIKKMNSRILKDLDKLIKSPIASVIPNESLAQMFLILCKSKYNIDFEDEEEEIIEYINIFR